jgi:hypothetical protein
VHKFTFHPVTKYVRVFVIEAMFEIVLLVDVFADLITLSMGVRNEFQTELVCTRFMLFLFYVSPLRDVSPPSTAEVKNE